MDVLGLFVELFDISVLTLQQISSNCAKPQRFAFSLLRKNGVKGNHLHLFVVLIDPFVIVVRVLIKDYQIFVSCHILRMPSYTYSPPVLGWIEVFSSSSIECLFIYMKWTFLRWIASTLHKGAKPFIMTKNSQTFSNRTKRGNWCGFGIYLMVVLYFFTPHPSSSCYDSEFFGSIFKWDDIGLSFIW